MTIGLSHGGTNIYSSAAPSHRILVGTREGAIAIDREGLGAAWQVVHRAVTDNHISAIIKEPKSGLLFAGAFQGRDMVSADEGMTWEARNQGMTQNNVYSLAAKNVNGRVRVFPGTEPAHPFVSENWGRNWRDLPNLRSVPSVPKWSFPAPPHIGHVKPIDIDPERPDTTYASVEVGGLLRSTDGGKS